MLLTGRILPAPKVGWQDHALRPPCDWVSNSELGPWTAMFVLEDLAASTGRDLVEQSLRMLKLISARVRVRGGKGTFREPLTCSDAWTCRATIK